MAYLGRAGRSDDGKLWHKFAYWSILSGGVGIFIRLMMSDRQYGIQKPFPSSEELIMWIGAAMTTGAVVRLLIGARH
jgi:hypothetical protein